jgi:hypothetical protein
MIYLHFAEEFGARQTDPDLLDEEGEVDFEKVRKSRLFKNELNDFGWGLTKGLRLL